MHLWDIPLWGSGFLYPRASPFNSSIPAILCVKQLFFRESYGIIGKKMTPGGYYMATTLNFRSALNGFNREDVVHYIEFMNSKYNTQVQQLTTEAEELHRMLEQQSEAPDLSDEVARLNVLLDEAAARQDALEQEREQLKEELAKAYAALEDLKQAQNDAAAQALAAQELEAYRRAEQAERTAKLRAQQLYQQATGTLAQATAQVDDAAMGFRQIADEIGSQLQQLQTAMDGTKNALLDAATTMYSIRPQSDEI